MKENLETILFMGLGVLSETNDKVKEVSNHFYQKGKDLYEKGVIANEELKHKISEVVKESVTVVNIDNNTSKEDILKNIENLSSEERKELINILNKKGWSCEKRENGEGNNN